MAEAAAGRARESAMSGSPRALPDVGVIITAIDETWSLRETVGTLLRQNADAIQEIMVGISPHTTAGRWSPSWNPRIPASFAITSSGCVPERAARIGNAFR